MQISTSEWLLLLLLLLLLRVQSDDDMKMCQIDYEEGRWERQKIQVALSSSSSS
jgi:hypothetical protein